MAVYLVCYIISFILARQHFYMLSGLVLITAALWLYIKDYRETGNLIHLRGLFCLFFVGGQGISCFKLSRLQTDWDLRTWVCLGLAVLTFWIVFEVLHRIYDGWSAADMQSVYRFTPRLNLRCRQSGCSIPWQRWWSYPSSLFSLRRGSWALCRCSHTVCPMPIPISMSAVSIILRFPACWCPVCSWCTVL